MLGLKLIHISKRGPWAQFHLSLARPDKYNSDIIDDSKNLFEWKHLKKIMLLFHGIWDLQTP